MANRSIEPHVYENDFDRLALLDQRLELLAQTASEVREDLSWLHTRFGYARAQAFTGLPPGTIRNWSNFLPIAPVLARAKEHRTWMLDPEREPERTEPAAAVPQQPSTVERPVQTEPAAVVPQQPSTVERSERSAEALAERDGVKLFKERGRETFRHLVHGDWNKAVDAVIDDEGRVDEDMLWRELGQRNVSRAAEDSRDSRGA